MLLFLSIFHSEFILKLNLNCLYYKSSHLRTCVSVVTFTRQLIKCPPRREGSESKVMLTGAKQWGPLPVLEKGREDTSNRQVSRDSVLICLCIICLYLWAGGQTVHTCGGQRIDSLWEATPSTMCVLRFELGSPGLVAKAFTF